REAECEIAVLLMLACLHACMLACLCRPLRWYVPATSPCQVVLGCRAVPTRCKYVPVSSRFSSLKTDGRHNPAPQPTNKLRSCWKRIYQQIGVSAVALGRP